jgi:hypothetical protein
LHYCLFRYFPNAVAAVSTYVVDGVAVKHYTPATHNGKPSLVMVHDAASST